MEEYSPQLCEVLITVDSDALSFLLWKQLQSELIVP